MATDLRGTDARQLLPIEWQDGDPPELACLAGRYHRFDRVMATAV